MRKSLSVGIAVLVLCGVEQGVIAAEGGFKGAVSQLSSDDYQERAHAAAAVQTALDRQMVELMGAGDAESAAGVGGAVREHLAFTTFLTRYLTAPAEARLSALKFMGQAEVLKALESVFAEDPTKREAGVKAIAGMSEVEADGLLAALIDAPQRAVSLCAMEAAWDRKPSAAVTGVLWNRAVGLGMKWSIAEQEKLRETFAFRGEVKAVDTTHQFDALRDGETACEVLMQIQDPAVEGRIVEALSQWHEMQVAQKKPGQFQMAQGEAQQNLRRLMGAYRPAKGVVLVLGFASEPVRWTKEYAGVGYCDNRTDWVALCGELMGVDMGREKMKMGPTGESVYKFATAADEEGAIEVLKKWVEEHPEKKGASASIR